jgi:TPR repeat protein
MVGILAEPLTEWGYDGPEDDACNMMLIGYSKGIRRVATSGPLTSRQSLREAAEWGQADAQYLLGFLQMHCDEVAKDPAEGARWLEKAAEQGHERVKALLDAIGA